MINKEDFFIKQFKNKYIGDDGVFIDGYVYAQDSFFEDVHFKRNWFSYYDIAKKSMLVNISDAIVMNAKVKFFLISCSLPRDMTKTNMCSLANGFKDMAKLFNAQIIGGDTICADKLHITITTISKTKKPIYRNGMKNNNLIAYTNSLGNVKKQLNMALRYNKISKYSKFTSPILNSEFYFEVSKYITSSIDISDGLHFELARLSKSSNMGIKFLKKIHKSILCSGEEYEILFSFDKKYLSKIQNIALKHRVKINVFAQAKKNTKIHKCICKSHHF